MIYLNWLSVKLFGNPCLLFWRCGWCYLFLWNLWILDQFRSWNLARNQQNRTKDAPGEAKLVQWGYPRGSEKQVAKKRSTGLKFQAVGSKMGSQIARLAILLVIFFGIFPHHFWDCFLIVFSMVFGNVFCINFLLYLDVFGYLFETSCFG